MTDFIVNRVANSTLVTIDLEDFYDDTPRIFVDFSQWLEDGLILREQSFRAQLNQHNWTAYKGAHVAIGCSTDVIIPAWASMLVATYIAPIAQTLVQGSLKALDSAIFQNIIENMDASAFEGKPVIIKGCSKKPVPPAAYVALVCKLQPIVKSLMFGEACSTVPLFKN